MIELIPYVHVNGVPTVSEENLIRIFQKMEDDDLVNRTFFDGDMTKSGFINFVNTATNIITFPVLDDEVAGMAWLNQIKDNWAFANFCFFKNSWGGACRDIAKKIIDYWFSFPGENGPLFDVLLGVTPKSNEKALKFIKQIGFTVVGEIPKIVNNVHIGDREPGIISYKLRE